MRISLLQWVDYVSSHPPTCDTWEIPSYSLNIFLLIWGKWGNVCREEKSRKRKGIKEECEYMWLTPLSKLASPSTLCSVLFDLCKVSLSNLLPSKSIHHLQSTFILKQFLWHCYPPRDSEPQSLCIKTMETPGSLARPKAFPTSKTQSCSHQSPLEWAWEGCQYIRFSIPEQALMISFRAFKPLMVS